MRYQNVFPIHVKVTSWSGSDEPSITYGDILVGPKVGESFELWGQSLAGFGARYLYTSPVKKIDKGCGWCVAYTERGKYKIELV